MKEKLLQNIDEFHGAMDACGLKGELAGGDSVDSAAAFKRLEQCYAQPEVAVSKASARGRRGR